MQAYNHYNKQNKGGEGCKTNSLNPVLCSMHKAN